MKKIICILLALISFTYVFGQDVKLKFNKNGKFKIIQFTDIHYRIGSDNAKSSIEVMKRILDGEKPDLVVFTGDIITCEPQKQGWDEVLEVVISRRIPYSVTLGNHDDEHNWTREQIALYLEQKPYSLFRRGPKDIEGVGNFTLKIENNKGVDAALLYFMDSNAYGTINGIKGWGWFAYNQVEWYRKTTRILTEENKGNPYPALAFFHIPLMEYELLVDSAMRRYTDYKQKLVVFGDRKEPECPGIINTGMFAAMVEAGDVMGTFVGHDHTNNYIGYLEGVALAYGNCSGGSRESKGGRIIELKENQRSFDTWLRNGKGEIFHKVTYPDSFIMKEQK